MISPSPTVTLFTEQIDSSNRALTLLASTAIHAGAVTLVLLGVLYAPVSTSVATDRFMVRRLDLHMAERPRVRAAQGASSEAAQQVARALLSAGHAPAAMLHVTVHARPGAQTLLQPDLAVQLAQTESIPVPQVILWSPRLALSKVVVAPRPAPPTAAVARPAPEAPNAEIDLADVNLASSRLPAKKLHILPSTTTPIVAPSASPVQLPPASVSQTAKTPTPAAILSLSDLRMKDGSTMLPPLNETANRDAPDAVTTGSGKSAGAQGHGGSPGAARVKASSNSATSRASAAEEAPPAPSARTGQGPAQGPIAGEALGELAATTQITLPKDGRFGAVVVGDALEDQFPEMAGMWNGRIAYTVYLHVGLARSWILQYALPSNADAAQAGSISHIEAPWPYNIVRPNLAPGAIDADAVLVHGFVGQTGRFEQLSIAFPQDLPQAQFLLKSLERWQFRPAAQNGQAVRVEVLLIIPEELD
ncbi:MAG: hypothetical protein ACLGP3_11925 [Acidobacteriota bacterium]